MIFKRHSREYGFLLFGLGNPGPKYAATRHNAGWWLLDLLQERFPCSPGISRHRSQACTARIAGVSVGLIRPTTFMNLSGESLRAWTREYPETPFAVAYDDFALDVGRIRIRERGSAGGHNGMKSIIACLETDEILRLRIGIGQPVDEDIADYVLANPPELDRKAIGASLEIAVRCVEELVQGNIGRAQHLSTGQELPPKKERPPRPPRPQPKLTMADLIAGKLRGPEAEASRESGKPAEDSASESPDED